jgi:hypothetical protein
MKEKELRVMMMDIEKSRLDMSDVLLPLEAERRWKQLRLLFVGDMKHYKQKIQAMEYPETSLPR